MNIDIHDTKLNNFIYLDVKLTFCAYKYNFYKDKAL